MTKDNADKARSREPQSEGEQKVNKMLGMSLRKLRKARGWSAKEVGDAIGINEATAYRHERGESSIRVYHLLKYEKLYNVSLERLIHGKEKGSEKPLRPRKVRLEFDD